ncbi:MAG TPA: adenine deaminase [Bacteroidales bacterium]|nr:MAG: adenine deaminase [Bacteroidetes bacterium GWF2_33_38]OFY76592.1 MAG: adenine deaminase [Bacteroidetes bacterium RIFOXYA12_FULL_33_9]HBF88019.1 adenine deaminase [Bacteroidales bacterium]
MKEYKGIIADVFTSEFYKGVVFVENSVIKKIVRQEHNCDNYILPGLVDSHVHIESSMSTPSAFAKEAVKHGTVAAVCDPHEIANVLGVEGINYMISNGNKTPFKFFFGAPSCVPATDFETSGAILDSVEVDKLLQRNDIYFLSEMMNYPGVIYENPDVMNKLSSAKKYKKRIDGHAPSLSGENLKKYIEEGITSDHECSTINEAIEKIKLGVKIQIREGSAAKNFANLYTLITTHNESVMLCTDDSHPEELLKWHINKFFVLGKKQGISFFDILKVATLNPVLHYNLNVGLLREGDKADFIIIDNPENFKIIYTVINGVEVFANNKTNFRISKSTPLNNFNARKIIQQEIQILEEKPYNYVIEVIDGELITKVKKVSVPQELNDFKSLNINKIVVLNRYVNSAPSVGLIYNFNITNGAIASSVAHDSHNIVAVGSDDKLIVKAINKLIDNKGGIVVCSGDTLIDMPLEIGGIMTESEMSETAAKYLKMVEAVKELKCNLTSPFMTLSFMSLPVIPEIKITDKGLFDVLNFKFI